MPRATTKADLIKSANDGFEKMWAQVDALSKDQQEQNFTYNPDEQDGAFHWKRDKNLRDVFAHLYEWHQLLLSWVKANVSGVEQSFLPKPYTWTNFQQMNIGFFEKHQNTSYSAVRVMLEGSHKQVMELIASFNDTELFEKKYFKWTGTTSLGQYCVSATASHYDWAMKKLKAYHKALKTV